MYVLLPKQGVDNIMELQKQSYEKQFHKLTKRVTKTARKKARSIMSINCNDADMDKLATGITNNVIAGDLGIGDIVDMIKTVTGGI